MLRAHVIRIYPSGEQERLMKRSCGVARKAYNEMLKIWESEYTAGRKPNWMKVQKAFVHRVDAEFPYMREVSCDVYYQPARHLNTAFVGFLKGISEYPTLKKKGYGDSFKACVAVHTDNHITLSKIGDIRCSELPRFSGRIVSATITPIADTWEASLLWETDDKPAYPKPTHSVLGIDLGVKTAITLSTGEKFEGPKPLKANLKKLRRLNKSLSRKQKGSNRRELARITLSRLHRRIRNIRMDWCHKVTTKIANDTQVAVMEDLNTKGMLKNHSMARAISDIGFYEIKRQLTYKMKDRGRELKFADRFFPSSRMCRKCGHIHEGLTLADRIFKCPLCGHTEDRDIHAAKNLESITTTQAHWESKGRGEAKAIGRRKTKRASSTKRQLELNVELSTECQDR
jgi:putative transposase